MGSKWNAELLKGLLPQVANIVFLESLGFARTSEDALNFLLGFLDRFPAFKGRPFWIAGQLYGGVRMVSSYLILTSILNFTQAFE